MVLSWSGFRHTDRFRGNGHKLCILLFSKAGKLKTSMVRVPYNKLLTNLASSSRTGEYWPEVVAVRTERSEVRTATTSGQYSPVRPSRSVSKKLLFLIYKVGWKYTQDKNYTILAPVSRKWPLYCESEGILSKKFRPYKPGWRVHTDLNNSHLAEISVFRRASTASHMNTSKMFT